MLLLLRVGRFGARSHLEPEVQHVGVGGEHGQSRALALSLVRYAQPLKLRVLDVGDAILVAPPPACITTCTQPLEARPMHKRLSSHQRRFSLTFADRVPRAITPTVQNRILS